MSDRNHAPRQGQALLR